MLTPTNTYETEAQEIELSNTQDWLIAEPKEIVPLAEAPIAEFTHWH